MLAAVSRSSVPPSLASRLLPFVGAFACLALVWTLRSVLVPLLLAFVLAYALDPIVDRLHRLGISRGLGAIVVLGGFLVGVVALLLASVPYFVDEFAAAGDQLPAQLSALHKRFDPWVLKTFHVTLPHTWSELVTRIGEGLRTRGPQAVEGIVAALFGTINAVLVVVGALIVPLFALYLLIDFDRIVASAKRLVPRRFAPSVLSIASDVHGTLGGYVRGQITACVVLALLYAGGLRAIDLRLAIPVGIFTGCFAFVPYVGFGVGASMAIAMALLDWKGPEHLALTVGVMLFVQLCDALVVTPRIVGRSVGLSPLEVLLSLMAAGTLFGFLGVLLAVPIGATAKIVLSHATRAYLASEFYASSRASSPPGELGS